MEYRPLGSSTVVLSLGCRASRNLRRHGAEAAGSRVHFRASGSGPRSGGGGGLGALRRRGDNLRVEAGSVVLLSGQSGKHSARMSGCLIC